MKKWILSEGQDASRLQIVETEIPQPKHGEVVIKMRAASLNYRDLLHADNSKFMNLVPLSDGAGEILAVGESVDEWKIGDRVAPTFFRDWVSGRFKSKYHSGALGGAIDGVLSEYFVSPAHGIVRIPDEYSFKEAATLPCAGLTAWCALISRGHFQAGDSVLLQGTGGVSIWGLQITVAAGGTAIITSSSDEKLEKAREMGASFGINYRKTPDWEREVWNWTGKQGVDHILEVGGPQTLEKSVKSVAEGGHIANIGVLTGFDSPGNIFPLVAKNATMSGIYVGDRESFENFVRFLNVTRIKPVIDRTFGFDETVEAFEYMKSGAHFGKVVISIDD